MKSQFQKIKAALFLSLILFSAFAFTGCPASTKTVKAAVDASYRLPATTNDLIKQIADGRDAGILSADDARHFGEYLNAMAKAEVVFVEGVKALQATFEATGHFDPVKLKNLRTYFDAAIVGPFLHVLESARVLSGSAATAIMLAIAALRLILREIGSGFGSSNMRILTASR